YTVEDVSATIYSFPAGALGVIYATNGAIPNHWVNDYRVVAQKITAEFSNANNATLTFTAGPERPPLVIASERNIPLAEKQDSGLAILQGRLTQLPLHEGA